VQKDDVWFRRLPCLAVKDPQVCNVCSVEFHNAPSAHSVSKSAATLTAFIVLFVITQ